MSPDRHYHLQSEEANRRLDALLEQLRVPEATWPFYADMLTTALKMYEDGAGVADLKIANAAFKEIRYGFKVFAPWRNVPKVTVFGSARTPRAHPISEQAYAFGKRITEAGWMVMTGAGGGVMGSAQEGAGAERSFGLNIRLPFEQEANPWIADDPKLISFKYFFTRKLFLVREAHAMTFLPGGFGTADEAFEAMTLIQTGKSPVLPLVMLDEPGGTYWKTFDEFVRREMVGRGMVSPNDPGLYRITDDVEKAAAEVEGFYKNYHSQRYVRDALVLRIRRLMSPAALADLNARFVEMLTAPAEQSKGPLPGEGD
ncbi:MAG: LOG family protein, partial [Candidatus Rokuibacteriota bacterium]